MRHSLEAVAVACILAAAPALAQLSPPAGGALLTEAQLAPVRGTLAQAQQRLQDLGYHAVPNGRFDAATRNAVELYQSDHGLRPTGEVDLSTLASLGIPVSGQSTAMLAPEPGQQYAMLPPDTPEQVAEARFKGSPAYNIPHLRTSDYESSPQTWNQPEQFAFQGVPGPLYVDRAGRIPGVEPSYPTEDLIRNR